MAGYQPTDDAFSVEPGGVRDDRPASTVGRLELHRRDADGSQPDRTGRHPGERTVAMTAAARRPPPRPLYLDVDDRAGLWHVPCSARRRGRAHRRPHLPRLGLGRGHDLSEPARLGGAAGGQTAIRPSGSTCRAPATARAARRTRTWSMPGDGQSTWRRRWLEGLPDVDRVAAIGMGLGGSIAALAVAEGRSDRRPGALGGAGSGAGLPPRAAGVRRTPEFSARLGR